VKTAGSGLRQVSGLRPLVVDCGYDDGGVLTSSFGPRGRPVEPSERTRLSPQSSSS